MHFLDSSAMVKLVLDEPESAALVHHLGALPFVTSEIARTEVVRAVVRRDAARLPMALDLIARAHLIALSSSGLRVAARLDPAALRTLDAIHLAAALLIADEITSFITYDVRLLEAAEAQGLTVASPM